MEKSIFRYFVTTNLFVEFRPPPNTLFHFPFSLLWSYPPFFHHLPRWTKGKTCFTVIWRSQIAARKVTSVNKSLHYEIVYQLDAIDYLFVFFQLDLFRAYTPIFRSNECYNLFTYAAYKEIVSFIVPEDGRIGPKQVELKDHK